MSKPALVFTTVLLSTAGLPAFANDALYNVLRQQGGQVYSPQTSTMATTMGAINNAIATGGNATTQRYLPQPSYPRFPVHSGAYYDPTGQVRNGLNQVMPRGVNVDPVEVLRNFND